MVNPVHFSSKKDNWETPHDLFNALDSVYGFSLDAAAEPHNAKVSKYFTKEIDGLSQDWSGEMVWLNPPYGIPIRKWVQKAHSEAKAKTVMLLPARTDTKWFHEGIIDNGHAVEFIKGRLKFHGAESTAPFPSMLVYFYCDPINAHICQN